MAFDFPATPANGASFTPVPGGPTWVWDGQAWRAGSGALPLGVIISDTAPANPYHGLLWWESDTGNTFIFYVDPGGAPGQWVQFNVAPPTVSNFLTMPPGIKVDYFGQTAPAGTRFCDGSQVSRTTFAALYAVVGDAFGAGDGTTTFNLPDLRGRLAAGRDDMGGTDANRLGTIIANNTVVGGVGGVQSIALTAAQLPAHTHTYNDRTSANLGGGGTTGVAQNALANATNTGNGLSGAAHPNVQPTMIVNTLITTGGVT
jgi:microcystin-dependent protein